LKPIPPHRLLENPRWKLFPIPERKKEYGINIVKSQDIHMQDICYEHKSIRHIEISTKTVASGTFFIHKNC
jgi:hypothetical protein